MKPTLKRDKWEGEVGWEDEGYRVAAIGVDLKGWARVEKVATIEMEVEG